MPQATALKKRIAPSVALKLELADDSGATFTREFRLSFDFNAAALIEEKTGLNLLTAEVWTKGLSSRSLSIMFWAAVLANHQEYAATNGRGELTEEGLEIIRSYMDVGNIDVIHEHLWNAYFISLPKEKREALEKARAELTAAAKAGQKPSPLAAAPETAPLHGSSSGPSQDTISAST
jgi:hypothetical protein